MPPSLRRRVQPLPPPPQFPQPVSDNDEPGEEQAIMEDEVHGDLMPDEDGGTGVEDEDDEDEDEEPLGK